MSSLQAIPLDKINAARLLGEASRVSSSPDPAADHAGLVASAILVFSLSASSYLAPMLISGAADSCSPADDLQLRHRTAELAAGGCARIRPLVVVVAITYAFSALMNRLSNRGRWEMV